MRVRLDRHPGAALGHTAAGALHTAPGNTLHGWELCAHTGAARQSRDASQGVQHEGMQVLAGTMQWGATLEPATVNKCLGGRVPWCPDATQGAAGPGTHTPGALFCHHPRLAVVAAEHQRGACAGRCPVGASTQNTPLRARGVRCSTSHAAGERGNTQPRVTRRRGTHLVACASVDLQGRVPGGVTVQSRVERRGRAPRLRVCRVGTHRLTRTCVVHVRRRFKRLTPLAATLARRVFWGGFALASTSPDDAITV